MSDHVLKVEMGESTNYHLTCNLDDAADCHQVCTAHPEVCTAHLDGCYPMDVEGECVREVYRNGCTIAEWVNDGGIESVGFEHIVEIPVMYQWNASHDYPSIHAASVPVLETPPPTENDRLNAIFSELECCVEGLFDGEDLDLNSRDALLAIVRKRFSGAPVPAPLCPHNRVEMLARLDDETVGNTSGLLWSPICRDCGDDVPMAAPPVGGGE